MPAKVSIVILNWNGKQMTLDCLDSIKKNTSYPNYEVIVVDQGSNDGSAEAFEKIKWIKLIPLKDNIGFSAANNLGFKKGKGTYFFMLNNDTIVTKNWLTEAVKVLESDRKIGVVGCYEKENPDFKRADKDVLTVSGATMLMKRNVLDKIGFLDKKNFSPIYGEETDFNFRASYAGYRIVQTYKSAIIHLACKTTESQFKSKYKYVLCETHRVKAMLYNLSFFDFLGFIPGLSLIIFRSIKEFKFHWLLESYWNNIKNFKNILSERKKRNELVRKLREEQKRAGENWW